MLRRGSAADCGVALGFARSVLEGAEARDRRRGGGGACAALVRKEGAVRCMVARSMAERGEAWGRRRWRQRGDDVRPHIKNSKGMDGIKCELI